MDPNFREIDFGRWEGLTAEEIQASDPVLYEDWQSGRKGFDYPGGEPRAAFRARVTHGVESLKESGACSVLLVCHKGVIRMLGEALTGRRHEIVLATKAGTRYTRLGDVAGRVRSALKPFSRFLRPVKVPLHRMRATQKRQDFSPTYPSTTAPSKA